jgi:hypothetical protein
MFDTDWKGYRIATRIGQALLAGAAVVVLVRGDWLAAAALAGFLLASFLFVRLASTLPNLFDLLFMLAALINAGGWAWDLFNKPGPYDEIAHFYTIFAITLAVGYVLYGSLMEGLAEHRVLLVVIIASLGIALGALWEVAEWLADFVTPKQIVSGLTDTITDIMLDSGGAILAALLNLWGLHARARARRPRATAAGTPARHP